MKKSLVALAVGAAFVAPSAFADVTISGAINMGIAYVDASEPTAGGEGQSSFQVTQNYSNVTISSVDDLGGGLKLDFAYQITAPTSGNNNVQNRNSHIGLVSDSWGGVWYGTNENIYERYLYTIDPLDGAAGIGGNLQMLGTPGFGTVFDAPSGAPIGSAGFYRRTEHTVWYDSPNFGGFTFGAAWYMPAYTESATGLDPWGYSVGVKYVGQGLPLQLWAAYEDHEDYDGLSVIDPTRAAGAGTDGTTDIGIQLGAAYTLGDVTIFGIYEMLEYKADGIGVGVEKYDRDAFAIGLKWNLASGYIGAQYIQALEGTCHTVGGATCNDDDTDAYMIGVGYYHNLSKQTQAYIMGSYIDNGDAQNYILAGASVPVSGAGVDYTAITIGLKHSF
jgi:predicted porin